ncbi:response regulator [Pontibacillus yanchengensis]|uniref:Response regulator n=2 Tax=Pontibacillus yanchengensis TaxID=462910 RepID=A0ACC7VH67_9BACI|nr:response regulator [Pontibacillus yanchengensis]MYL34002.1 response regulator [Pontibacillus yanchengensis]MYL54052.1 response regulator [Pontibacillus yanchengensis]
MKKILLADDEEVLRMLIVDTLEDEGYEIVETENGLDALEEIRANDYDLVILDYMMPGLTGIEVAREIQEVPHKQGTKILMLTAKNQQKDVEESQAAGINYYMSKPFSPMQLIDVVEEIVNA